MVAALVQAVEHPAQGTRIVDVPAIRARIPDRDIEGEEVAKANVSFLITGPPGGEDEPRCDEP